PLSFDTILSIRDTHCVGEVADPTTTTGLACDDDSGGSLTSKIILTNVEPGNLAITVDGYSSGSGAFTLSVHGVATVGQPCTNALFTGGANAVLVCPVSCTAGVCH